MTYAVKELFPTLQGEGANAGRAAVFLRFAGCNLWSGREADRASADCDFCDTDFVGTDGEGGASFADARALADAVQAAWKGQPGRGQPLVVVTGGEPALQLDASLVDALHGRGFEVAIETNGTLDLAPGIDWVCVSPKAGTTLKVTVGDELKLVYPQAGGEPHRFEDLSFRHFLLQPMDGPHLAANQRAAAEFCLHNPPWRLSLQMHKVLGIK